jgi:RNA polymerase sigma-70 factor (ECF subfamily)
VPESNASEHELVQRAKSGDAAAVTEIYQRHSPAIFRYFLYRVRERQTAEDLTGDVFVKMVEGLPRFEDRGAPLAAWLFRIAHDRVVDHHRRAALRQTETIADDLAAREPGPDSLAQQRLEAERLQAQMAALTDEQRTVIQLRFVEGYSLEECARLLGKTTGAIKALQHRALRQLAGKLTH